MDQIEVLEDQLEFGGKSIYWSSSAVMDLSFGILAWDDRRRYRFI